LRKDRPKSSMAIIRELSALPLTMIILLVTKKAIRFFYDRDFVHHNSIVIKIQPDATVCSLIHFTANHCTCFVCPPHPSSGVLKTVTAAFGTGHNIGTATCLQRPDLATL